MPKAVADGQGAASKRPDTIRSVAPRQQSGGNRPPVGAHTQPAMETMAQTTTTPTDALTRLRRAKAFILDMDGVLYRGNAPLPGVNEFLNAIAIPGRRYMLATNNSTASPAEYVAKLARMGIDVPESAILTSGTATRGYLLDNLPADAGIYVIGMPALREQVFAGTSFRPVQYGEEVPAAVVVGLDFAFNY